MEGKGRRIFLFLFDFPALSIFLEFRVGEQLEDFPYYPLPSLSLPLSEQGKSY